MDEAGLQAEYDFLKELGSGTFGTVWLVRHKATGVKLAAKLIAKDRMKSLAGNNAGTYLTREVTLLHKLRHPHIISQHAVMETPRYVVILLQFATGGDLEGVLQKFPRGVGETPARTMMNAILTALAYLHEHNVVHRDLKPENVLLTDRASELELQTMRAGGNATFESAAADDEQPDSDSDDDVDLVHAHTVAWGSGFTPNGSPPPSPPPSAAASGGGSAPASTPSPLADAVPLLPKLSDFGLAKACDERGLTSTVCGTPLYIAPEVLQQGVGGHGYDARVDVWSAGMLLWQLLTGGLPFTDGPLAPPLTSQITALVRPGTSLPFPPAIPQGARALLSRMLAPREKRISAAAALNHAWLKGGSAASLGGGRAPTLTRAPTLLQPAAAATLPVSPGFSSSAAHGTASTSTRGGRVGGFKRTSREQGEVGTQGTRLQGTAVPDSTPQTSPVPSSRQQAAMAAMAGRRVLAASKRRRH